MKKTYLLSFLVSFCTILSLNAQNLVLNGDFELGDQDFSSTYGTLGCGAGDTQLPEGNYCVKSSHAQYTGFAGWSPDCPDHTTGISNDGNKMIVNGDTTNNLQVWCQTVTVKPNTKYKFSTWLASIFTGNPAKLQFSINGQNIGTDFTASSTRCEWKSFFEIWESGDGVTSAEICIVNKNITSNGNDFMLDDIVFEEVGLSMPNVFTPDGNNFNDTFQPHNYIGIDAWEFKIYNRWGNIVYENEDAAGANAPEWNGKIKGDGADASPGVYYYVLNYQLNLGTETIKFEDANYLTLIR